MRVIQSSTTHTHNCTKRSCSFTLSLASFRWTKLDHSHIRLALWAKTFCRFRSTGSRFPRYCENPRFHSAANRYQNIVKDGKSKMGAGDIFSCQSYNYIPWLTLPLRTQNFVHFALWATVSEIWWKMWKFGLFWPFGPKFRAFRANLRNPPK